MFHTKENEKTNDLRLPLNCNTNAQSNNGAFVPSGYPDYCYLNRSGGGIIFGGGSTVCQDFFLLSSFLSYL